MKNHFRKLKKKRLFYKLLSLFILLFIGNEVNSFEIDKINEEVEARNFDNTVRAIFNSSSSGTGFIIGRKNNRCSILTANHVIEGNKLEEIEVLISPGKFVNIDKVIRPFNDKDLAIIQFDCSNIDKKYLNLTILPFINEKLWKVITPTNVIYISGYGIKSEMVKEPILRSLPGRMISFLKDPTDGYNMLYESNTTVGMSGGPIFMPSNLAIQMNDPSSAKSSFSYTLGYSKSDYSIPENNTDAENIAYKRCMINPLNIPSNNSPQYQREMESALDTFKFKVDPFNYNSINSEKDIPIKNDSYVSFKRKHCYKVASLTKYNCPFEYAHDDINILVGIHGRSEGYQYGGKSGYAFGTFLGEEKIIQWFKQNANELGIAPKDSLAYLRCLKL